MEKFLILEEQKFDGIHKVYKFPNNFGASLLKHKYSYGGKDNLWELAMIKFKKDNTYEIFYCDITNNDVLGYLHNSEVYDILVKIQNFSNKKCKL